MPRPRPYTPIQLRRVADECWFTPCHAIVCVVMCDAVFVACVAVLWLPCRRRCSICMCGEASGGGGCTGEAKPWIRRARLLRAVRRDSRDAASVPSYGCTYVYGPYCMPVCGLSAVRGRPEAQRTMEKGG